MTFTVKRFKSSRGKPTRAVRKYLDKLVYSNLNPFGLVAPESYWKTLKENPEAVGQVCWTGCGSCTTYKLVLNSILGINIVDCCMIHDWGYEFTWDGEASEEDRAKCDRVFRNNMYRKIMAGSHWYTKWTGLDRTRLAMAAGYFQAVSMWGASSYWMNKNKPEELAENI